MLTASTLLAAVVGEAEEGAGVEEEVVIGTTGAVAGCG